MTLKVRKPIYAFLLFFVLITMFSGIIFIVNFQALNKRINTNSNLKSEGIERIIAGLEDELLEASAHFRARNKSMIELTSYMLQDYYMEDGQYVGPEVFYDHGNLDGFVVTIENGNVIIPLEAGNVPQLPASLIESEEFYYPITFPDSHGKPVGYLISSKKIDGNRYFVDVAMEEEYYTTILDDIHMEETMTEIEAAYGCHLLWVLPSLDMVDTNLDADSKYELTYILSDNIDYIYLPETFDKYESLESLGITKEILEEKPSGISIDGTLYDSTFREVSFLGQSSIVIILMNVVNESQAVVTSVFLIAGLTTLFSIVFIMWMYWNQTYVRDHELFPSQSVTYKPSRIRKLAIASIIIGSLCIFLVAVFFQSLANLNRTAYTNRSAMTTIFERLVQDYNVNSAYKQDEEEWVVYFVERVADLLSGLEGDLDREYFADLNQRIDSEYMILFDSEGNEITASNSLYGLTLDSTENFQGFKNLLYGADTIIHDPEKDEMTGKVVQLIGARVPSIENDSYRVLITAIDPDKTWRTAEERSFNDFLKNLTQAGRLSVIIDIESGDVAYSNDPDLLGAFLPEFQLAENASDESDLDSFYVNQNRYYGPYASISKYRCYYLTEYSYIRENSLSFALISMTGFLVINLILFWFMMKNYTKENYKAAVRIKENVHHSEEIDMDSLDDLFEKEALDSGKKLIERWQDLIPEQKNLLLIQVLLGTALLVAIWFFSDFNISNHTSTINFIWSGNWKRGVNLLGFAGVVLVILSLIVFSFFKDILQRILCTFLDSKGETIVRLISSLTEYAAVLGAIYLIFGFLGFNTTVQITSVGIISLAISLGSKDLVADILAGIFIIFEGDFHVGDIVEINGYRGIVKDIGVRHTSLLGLGDNIKIFDNQTVKNVLNMSKLNSWYAMELNVSANQPLEEIEAMLNQELPNIAKKIPEIISGPYYKGVWSISPGRYTLSIICECDESMYRRVQRNLNHEVILLFNKYNFQLS